MKSSSTKSNTFESDLYNNDPERSPEKSIHNAYADDILSSYYELYNKDILPQPLKIAKTINIVQKILLHQDQVIQIMIIFLQR